ncbi:MULTISPECIES: hypothetical protein [Pantoea]|uniref:hypothetical protein n=1 Tax=Pantoea TaxID=53335 RepID=UPI000921E863|nr:MULTISPECIES: hypothetical protein [Pantoea]MDJ0034048.1 hypothetical protein [Pantoea ananatis]MDJ0043100.1 hypothetical protein [Pantoea ananatis]MDQ1228544.1 hypothetical protein [Pantoea ananatis]MDR6092225.1 hypothetical protein [Pantoea ananatis]PQK69781.1 hypothetical protein CG430_22510 [Pantoea ananatis]
MKMHLLTALVTAGCFSQMAVADDTLTTGSITNQTTATATVTINQPVTLENTLTPETGLKAGQVITEDTYEIAKGNLKIMEAGAKARLAIYAAPKGSLTKVYAVGHEGDGEYELDYMTMPTSPPESDFKAFETSDGYYYVSNNDINSLEYGVFLQGEKASKAPKAGNYVISSTGAVYNP